MAQREYIEIMIGSQKVRLAIRRSGKARRYSLRLLPEGTIEAVVPKRGSIKAIEQIIRANMAWLEKALQQAEKMKQQNVVRNWEGETTLPVFGQQIPFIFYPEPGRQKVFLKETDTGIEVHYGTKKSLQARLKKWYEVQALEFFSVEADSQARLVGKKIASVRIFNAKGRWGSCHQPTARLAFHWKLALAPLSVARYVVSHEVAHLVRADHSPAFWAVVANLEPDWKQKRKWLKKNGHTLVL